MEIRSPAFSNYEEMPAKYTCDGENINPPLFFSDIPDTASSLALIIEDPDAPSGIWTHWILWNIDPKTKSISENSTPKGAIEGQTSFDGADGPVFSYGGPCPSVGMHRYFFRLYALDQQLDKNAEKSREEILEEIEGHIIEEATLIGTYQRLV